MLPDFRAFAAPWDAVAPLHDRLPVLSVFSVVGILFPDARADLFDNIEVFYNRKRRQGYLGNISPDDFEQQSTGSF